MKLIDLFEDSEEKPLKLRIDNPGGEWLKGKREDLKDAKPNQFGNPSRLGSVTGSWTRHVLLPVDLVASLPGLNNEHVRVRKDDFDSLHDVMSKTSKLPLIRDTDKQYAPFIVVDMNGKAWVSEGNHRIMVAKKLRWKYIPIELRYFTGGEGESGKLTPDIVRKLDLEAHEAGFDTLDFKA